MEFLGYFALTIMGLTLGLVGAGGSILTIPILVYLLYIPVLLATSYSLVLVGASALVAAIRYQHHILFRNAIQFLIPSSLGVFGARHYIIPNLPHYLGGISIDKALVFLLLVFMGFAGYFMIRNVSQHAENNSKANHNTKVVFIGLSLGIVMGLLGAGGGFLIIPTLVLLMGFNMQEAVPTSLFIITINSFIGFAADRHNLQFFEWSQLGKFLGFAFLGMFIGLYIAKFINSTSLRKVFGYFVWVVGGAIFAKEFIL